MATIEDLREFREELKAKFGADASVAYANVSMTLLSIARHYGGATVQGKHFVYNPDDDWPNNVQNHLAAASDFQFQNQHDRRLKCILLLAGALWVLPHGIEEPLS